MSDTEDYTSHNAERVHIDELVKLLEALDYIRDKKMLKVMTIVGTRPELIKMSRVVEEFDKHTNHILVHTGQNYDYELNQIFFEDLGIRSPDYFWGLRVIVPAKPSDKLL